MAQRTLKAKYEAQDGATSLRRQILCAAKNQKEVYYALEDAAEEAPAAAPSEAAAPAAAPVAVAAAPVPVAAPSGGAAAAVEDVPPKAVDTVRVIVAQKLKKPASEIPLSKSLKELSGGKSTLQNEILGDLQVEFASAPEKAEDLPLDELGAALGVGYSALGKHAMALTNRMVASKFPGGFNITAARAHLNKQWGLGPLRSDSALFFGITNEPPKRLGSEAEAKAFLDALAQTYASYSGIALSAGGAGGAGGGAGGGGAVMNSEEFDAFVLKQEEHAQREIELLSRYLGKDLRVGDKKAEEEKVSESRVGRKISRVGADELRLLSICSRPSSTRSRQSTGTCTSTVSSLSSRLSRRGSSTRAGTGPGRALSSSSTTSSTASSTPAPCSMTSRECNT
jgi:fatty acid synthase subunit beta